jgi:hypothetical protein
MFPVGFKPPSKQRDQSPYAMLPWTNAFFCHQQGLAKTHEGFEAGFTPEFWNTLTEAQRAKFTQGKLEASRSFLLEAQARHRQDSSNYILRLTKVVGASAFRDQMNVLLERRGGILDVVWDSMVHTKATPTDALRDARKNAVRMFPLR